MLWIYFIILSRPEEDHLNSYVKPELLKRIQKAFPDEFKNDVLSRNRCRDMIIECVQFSMRVSTVKPVLKGHIWDKVKMALYDRGPLRRGSIHMKFTMTGQENVTF